VHGFSQHTVCLALGAACRHWLGRRLLMLRACAPCAPYNLQAHRVTLPARRPTLPCSSCFAMGEQERWRAFAGLPPLCHPHCLAAARPCSFLPRNVAIIGYARTQLTDEELRAKLRPRLEGGSNEVDKFLELCTYVQGGPPSLFPLSWGGMSAITNKLCSIVCAALIAAVGEHCTPNSRVCALQGSTMATRVGRRWTPRSTHARLSTTAAPWAASTTWRCRPPSTPKSAPASR
jgi:hypothetical protein